MAEIEITDQEFNAFRQLIYELAGISLSDAKKILLAGRLAKRLRHYRLASFGAYYRMVAEGNVPEELQIMVDLLTTNETYFFREPQHFSFLRDEVIAHRPALRPLRIWSAASSTGEEVYSIAMTLAEYAADVPWEVVGSDISTHVLAKAKVGHYLLNRTEGIPQTYMRKYCLKGVRSHAGSFLIAPEIRSRTRFCQINLMQPIDEAIGEFDVVFLRNVMIYFDNKTKTHVVHNLLPRLRTGGYLIIGHSETLNGLTDRVEGVRPTIYRKK